MSDEIYDGVDGEDVANLYEELYTLATDYANAKSTEQAKFKKKYPKKYGTIRRLLVNEIHSSNKAEGGIVGLFNGGQVDDFGDYSSVGDDAPSVDSGSDSDSGSDDNDYFTEEEDSARGGDYTTDDSGKFTGYGESYGESIQDSIDKNPQLKGYLGKQIKNLVDKGKVRDFEFDKDGRITGVYSSAPQLPGIFGGLASLLGLSGGKVYTGYGAGSRIPDSGDSGEEPSKMIRKIVEEKKKTESPLTEEELDYYVYGLGSKSKPMKTLSDVNEFISGLYSDTASPVGSKLSDNKRYLTLPNGKVIDLKTGKQLESVDGLELFMGGRI